MKLSFKFYPKLNDKQLEIIEELSYHTTKLYNIANYDCREKEFKSYVEMNKIYKNNYHKDFLHSHTYQHCLKVLEKNWKSYFASIKDYKKNPSKYLGMPKPPKFKNTNNKKNEIIFTNLAIRYQDQILKLSLSKAIKSICIEKSTPIFYKWVVNSLLTLAKNVFLLFYILFKRNYNNFISFMIYYIKRLRKEEFICLKNLLKKFYLVFKSNNLNIYLLMNIKLLENFVF